MGYHQQTDKDGELEINHQASPGLTKEQARKLGYDGRDLDLFGGGRVWRTATLACSHCPSVVVLNPMRTRGRTYCPKCNGYMCDGCAIVSREPDYVHRSRQELIDLLRSGKWRFGEGSSMSRPLLIPVVQSIEDELLEKNRAAHAASVAEFENRNPFELPKWMQGANNG